MNPKDNEALALAEFKSGACVVTSTPVMVTLETSSICNLRCVMCPHSIGAVERPKHLEEALAEKVSGFLGRAKSVQLHGIGEPLASPAFWSVLERLPEGCDASINTNLTLLDERRLSRLVASNIGLINVSVDAATAETYGKIRGHAFEELTRNVKRLIAARADAGKSRPLVYLNMTLMRANIEEAPAFVELAADLGADAACFWHLNRWPDDEMARYRTEKGEWVFDYAAEGLWDHPALSNRCLREAVEVGRRLGLPVHLDHNKGVFFDEEGSGHD